MEIVFYLTFVLSIPLILHLAYFSVHFVQVDTFLVEAVPKHISYLLFHLVKVDRGLFAGLLQQVSFRNLAYIKVTYPAFNIATTLKLAACTASYPGRGIFFV